MWRFGRAHGASAECRAGGSGARPALTAGCKGLGMSIMGRSEWNAGAAGRESPEAAFEPLEPRLLLSGGAAADPVAELAAGNNAFAYDVYQVLRSQAGNLFYSPLSISAALSMTYAGAAGRTAEQMADALHFTQPADVHHGAFGDLIERLTTEDDVMATFGGDDGQAVGRNGAPPVFVPELLPPPLDIVPDSPLRIVPTSPYPTGDEFTLNIANSLWGQQGYTFMSEFLDALAGHYDSPLRPTDFQADSEGARRLINQWVSDQTHEKINDIIPRGAIDSLTRLVLANAIYFNASWANSFDVDVTEAFHLPGDDVNVEMMRQTERFRYADGGDYKAVEMPYLGGDASMLVIVPDEGSFEQFEASLSADAVDGIVSGLGRAKLRLTMPKFESRSKVSLAGVLSRLGMPDAFDPGRADFSGMADSALAEQFHLSDVLHEAWISVDAEGTEAAAATVVIVGTTNCGIPVYEPPIEFTVDRPFIYLIRDTQTNTTLFVGRINDASAFDGSDAVPDPVPHDPVLPDPAPLPFPASFPAAAATKSYALASLVRLGSGGGRGAAGLAGPLQASAFRQSLVTVPKVTAVRPGRVRAGTFLQRTASAIAGGSTVRLDALDLHPVRKASLPAWMRSVLDEVGVQSLIVGLREVVL